MAAARKADPASAGEVTVSRLTRRKAATRQALLDAARRMLAAGTAAGASIQDITEAADVGFGTFYNHFDDKDELFRTASEQVLEQWGNYLDHAPPDTADPAVVFATAFRRSGRMLITHPQEARLLCQHGFALLDSPLGLAPHARRDLRAAMLAGRFTLPADNVELALSKTAGYLFALSHTWLVAPDTVDAAVIDEAAAELLRIFGIRAAEARRMAHMPLTENPSLSELI